MTFTHDMSDPKADAEARSLDFTFDQACYTGHHIRNALQTAEVTPLESRARLLILAKTIDERAGTGKTQSEMALKRLSAARRAVRALGHHVDCSVYNLFSRNHECDCGLESGDLELARAEEFAAKIARDHG